MPRQEPGEGVIGHALLPTKRLTKDRSPARGPGKTGLCGPIRQTFGGGKDRPMPPHVQFIFVRQDQMLPAPELCAVPGEGQGMLDHGKGCIDRQPLPEQARHLPQQPAGGRQGQRFARRIIGPDPPAVQRRRHPPRQVAVRGDQCGACPGFRRLTQDQGNRQGLGPFARCFDQRQPGGRRSQIGQVWPFVQPLVGDRRGPQRQRHQLVAVRRSCGNGGPGLHRAAPDAQPLHQPTKAVLWMIFRRQRVVHAVPDLIRQVEVEPRQHNRPLWQPRHRQHQKGSRSPRSGRSRHDHRPLGWRSGPTLGQVKNQSPQPPFGIRRITLQRLGHDAKKGLRPRPVTGMFGHIQRGDPVGGDPFALHLLHQAGQAFGQIEQRGAGEIGDPGLQQPVQQLRQFQPPSQRLRRGRGRQGGQPVHLGHQQEAGQKPRAPRLKLRLDPFAHPLRVQDQRDPRHVFRGAGAEPVQKARDKLIREIHPGGQGEKVWRFNHVWQSEAEPPPEQSLPDAPRRTICPDAARQRQCLPRSCRSTDGSAKRPDREWWQDGQGR